MAIEKFEKDMRIIGLLDDEPNDVGGLSAAELKDKFDEGGKAIQEYINNTLVPAVEEVERVSGATGNSPYQIAVSEGYTGTSEEFYAAMGEIPEHISDGTTHVGANYKTDPVDADSVALVDSEDGNQVKRLLWSQLVASLLDGIPCAKIESGSYTGDGTYGADSPTSPGTTISSKLLVIMGSSGFGICVAGQKMKTYSVEPGYAGARTERWETFVPLQSGNDVSWYSATNEYPQLNVSGEEYVWVNIG